MPWQFIEQFERMERWHKRLKVIYERVPQDMGDLEELDDVLAFFQNCYHLKDWIKNDKSSGITADDVESFVVNSESLMACGGLCVGSKHLKISDPKFENNADVNRHYWLPPGGRIGNSFTKRTFMVTYGEKLLDALELANNCMAEWQKFFKNKGYSWS